MVFSQALKALLRKNILLKRTTIASSIAELLLPIILFWILSFLGWIMAEVDTTSSESPFPSSRTLVLSRAISELTGYSQGGFVFVPKNHPVTAVMKALIEDGLRPDPPGPDPEPQPEPEPEPDSLFAQSLDGLAQYSPLQSRQSPPSSPLPPQQTPYERLFSAVGLSARDFGFKPSRRQQLEERQQKKLSVQWDPDEPPQTPPFHEFDTMKEAQEYLTKNGSDISFVWEFRSAPTPYANMTTEQINALTAPPAWDYTIHPTSDVFSSSPENIFDIYHNIPYYPEYGLINAETVTHHAILRLNGLFGQDALNVTKTSRKVDVTLGALATKEYSDDTFVRVIVPIISALSALSFLPSVFSIVAQVVQEKETFLKQTLIMMGASKYYLYLSWFIMQYIFMTPTLLIVSGLYNYYSAPSIPYPFLFLAFSIYYMALIAFCLFASSFFSRVKIAQTTVSIVYLLLSALGAVASLLPSAVSTVFSVFSLQSLFGQYNLILIDIQRAIRFNDGKLLPLFWSSPNTNISFWACFFISICQVVGYFLLTIYVDNIMPGEYNNPLPFYYPFLPSYWFGLKKKRNVDINTPLLSDNEKQVDTGLNNHFIQPLTQQEQRNVAVRIRNVVKSFKGSDGNYFNAVDNLCTDMMRGQIFSILGHNGAGKSTTINMMCGIYGQNEGTIELFDRQGNQIDPSNPRGAIGVCPQYNSLYPRLTVNQHMRLFSSIKQDAMGVNIPSHEVEYEIADLLKTLKLGPEGDNKGDVAVETLSGGQKRKVCLALALLHKPSILILDEPSSGTDIGIQRQIWSLLGKLKQDAAILLSSHHLEESEIGDRIGIMVKGQMMCCGSSMFLKKQFGVGYQLSVEKLKVQGLFDRITAIDNSVNQNTNDKTFGGARGAEITTVSGQRLMSLLQPSFLRANLSPLPPDAIDNDFKLTPEQVKLLSVMTLHNDNQSNLTFGINYENGDYIPDILDFLDKYKTQLRIVDTALSITSLEDVFIMANNGTITEHIASQQQKKKKNDEYLFSNPGSGSLLSSNASVNDSGSENLFLPDSKAPVNNDAHQLNVNTAIWDEQRVQRNPIELFGIQVLTLLKKRAILQTRDLRSIIMTFIIPLLLCVAVVAAKYSMAHFPLRELTYHDFKEGHPLYYSAIDVSDTYSPSRKELVNNANLFSKSLATYPKSNPLPLNVTEFYSESNVYNWDSYKFGTATLFLANTTSPSNPRAFSPMFTAMNNFSPESFFLEGNLYYNATSYYAPYVVQPRLFETIANFALEKAKPVVEKFGNALNINLSFQTLISYDVVLFHKLFSVTIIIISCLLYPSTLIYNLVKERSDRVVHLHRISGVTPSAYWTANAIFDYVIYWAMCGMMLASLKIFKLELPPPKIIYPSLAVYGALSILFVYTFSLLFKSPATAQTIITLTLILGPLIIIAVTAIICDKLNKQLLDYLWVTLIIPSSGICYPLFQSMIKIDKNQDLAKTLLKWMICVPIYFVFFWILSGIVNKHWLEEIFATTLPTKQRDEREVDPDVLEQERLVKSGPLDPNEYPLVSRGLRKVFKGFTAVNDLYFTMKKQETFALLGGNGAGKSTTIAMLTSDIISSKSLQSVENPSIEHTAYIAGYDIIKNNEDCWKELGFCPQFDALNLQLTGRETLTMYCYLRGVTANAKLFVDDLLNALGIEYAADRRIAGYSLGMRRRLSIGVALVGNPGVVLIDEGTTGVDPISRSNIRLLLQQTCRNRALLITSHNLEEIEALADRIGIMSRGQMKTWGTKNELKRKLTNHYQLHLHIVAGNEYETCARVLSALAGVPLSQELESLLPRVTAQHLLSESVADEALSQQLSQSQAKNHIVPLSAEDLLAAPAYQYFITQCRIASPSGCYITECRHTTGVLNISKDLVNLPQLFKKVKEIKGLFPSIEAYSCSQVPLDQVFLEIVRKDEEELAVEHGASRPTNVHQIAQVQYQQLQQYQQQGGYQQQQYQQGGYQQQQYQQGGYQQQQYQQGGYQQQSFQPQQGGYQQQNFQPQQGGYQQQQNFTPQ